MRPDQVTAVIVTRGDVDLRPVLDSLIFDDVVVWDNSVEVDRGTWGRYTGTLRGKHGVYYSQDDDIIHTPENQQRIIDAYEPGVLTGCMWPEWSDGARKQGIPDGYDDLVFAGSGSVFDNATVIAAEAAYFSRWPYDDFFQLWADTIIGVIAPTKQLEIRFEALPHAEAPNRMANMPDAVAQKTEAIRRARLVRDRLSAESEDPTPEPSRGRPSRPDDLVTKGRVVAATAVDAHIPPRLIHGSILTVGAET